MSALAAEMEAMEQAAKKGGRRGRKNRRKQRQQKAALGDEDADNNSASVEKKQSPADPGESKSATPDNSVSRNGSEPHSKLKRILTDNGCSSDDMPATEILDYIVSMATDDLTDEDMLAGVLESMDVISGEHKTAAAAMIQSLRKPSDSADKAKKKTHKYANIKRNEMSVAMVNELGWGVKKLTVNDGMNGWVGNGATIVDWLAKNSKGGKRKIRLAAKEEERRKKLLEKHIQAVKNLRLAEAQALKDIPSRLLPSANARQDIHADDCCVSAPDGKVLVEDASLRFVFGRKYGLIGANGSGKTTLLRMMARKDLGIPKDLRLVHSSQEIDGSDKSALDEVLGCDYELLAALEEEREILADENNIDPDRLAEISERLDLLEASTAKSRAIGLLSGLNFTQKMLTVPTKHLSGGWRQRISLARALYLKPNALLLDEPTNHLDMESVLWLEQFLADYDKTLIVVSHDRSFLNNVCTDIVHLHRQTLEYFRGDYDNFVDVVEEQRRRQEKAYESQQKERAHMQAYIDKNRYSAANAAMAQSRIKAMEKMVLVEKPITLNTVYPMQFPDPGELKGGNVISVTDVDFRYSDKTPKLFEGLHFGISGDCRIGLVGPNGIGKSTLLNILYGYTQPTRGYVERNQRLRIACFTQHHTASLDLRLTPLEQMRVAYDGLAGTKGEEKARSALGRFGISAELANRPIVTLSGGQKSRVVLAMVAHNRPHLLILDEPTNHLDMETIAALAAGVQAFKGGVICVSHDEYFINLCMKDIWEVKDRNVHPLGIDGLTEYRNRALKLLK